MLDFIIKSGIIILGLYLYLFLIVSWIDLIDNSDEDYEYCDNCKHGFCTEDPRSNQCQKWREQHNENQGE